jgi:hypothetical protein
MPDRFDPATLKGADVLEKLGVSPRFLVARLVHWLSRGPKLRPPETSTHWTRTGCSRLPEGPDGRERPVRAVARSHRRQTSTSPQIIAWSAQSTAPADRRT